MPYREHLTCAADLETSHAAVRAGFVQLALEKNRRATPHVAEARALKALASRVPTPERLLEIPGIAPAMLTASGVSDKAAQYMEEEDRREAIQGLIANFLEPSGAAFVEELVFRFLLTRGDTLGGSMRNVGGAMAQRKLTRALLASLALAGVDYKWLHASARNWISRTDNDADIEIHLRGLSWKAHAPRTAMYNLNVAVVKKNIDLCILSCASHEISEAARDPSRYLALGELKGGIDPAGADEHWKTAHRALGRITDAFSRIDYFPKTFFVGAAVERSMATEIWRELRSGKLANAANLTGPDQVASLCRWILTL